MIPGFIIEEIRKREQKEQSRPEVQPTLDIPLIPREKPPDADDEPDKDRGVTVIELFHAPAMGGGYPVYTSSSL